MQSLREHHATAATESLGSSTRATGLRAPAQRTGASRDSILIRPADDAAFLKRALDLLVAGTFVIVTAPLMLLIALFIRLDSEGPVFFRQQRTGLGGRVFSILKFRTMRVMEDGDAVIQVREDDDRITRVGRWLRRTSLDELPQFLNVLVGDMSIVGPRPHAVAHDRYYGALIEDYAVRHRVKPGITGWAQIHGLRGATPTVECMQARVRHDLWYARHASFMLDIEILARTPYAVLAQRNAY